MAENLSEAINRGNNLLGIAYIAVTSIGLIDLVFSDNEWIDRADDIAIIVIAILGVAWYLSGRNRYKRSLVPLVIVAVSFLVKVVALRIEFDDPAAAGDDYGVVIAFFIMMVVEAIILYRTRKTAADPVKVE
jgi:hypothetical protein